MSLMDAIVADLQIPYAEQGIAATYTPPSGEPSDCTVILNCGAGRTDEDLHLSVRTTGEMRVRESDAPTVGFTRGGVFGVESERWSILRTISRMGGEFIFEVQRESR